MTHMRLPGLSEAQQQQLFHALMLRSELNDETRNDYPVPQLLVRSFYGQGWWALLKELHDRPLMTALGLAAATTYPIFWLIHLVRHWI